MFMLWKNCGWEFIEVFGQQIIIRQCLFHLGQNIIRRIQKDGLVPLYDQNEEYKKLVRGLAALSFLRVEQVRHGFDLLRAEALRINVPNNAMSIFDYFEWYRTNLFLRKLI